MEDGAVGLPGRAPTNLTTPITEREKRMTDSLSPFDRNAPPIQIPPAPRVQEEQHQQPSAAREKLVAGFRKVVGRVRGEGLARFYYEAILEKRRAEPLAGYPRFAEFLGSDERWSICRKFSHLQARLILEKQDDMRQIEVELEEMDAADNEDTPNDMQDGERVPEGKLFTRHRRDQKERLDRREFFKKAERTYKEYAALLTAANQLTKLDKPARHEWKSVSNFVSEAKPVVARESEWIDFREDLVTLRKEREHAFFDAIVETIINRVKNWQTPAADAKNTTERMQKWLQDNASAGKVANVTNMVFLSILVPLLFVVPIYALSMVREHIGQSIAVLIAFAIAFTSVLAVGTPAKTHEVWSCAAAYLAVLVVFLGSVSHSKDSTQA